MESKCVLVLRMSGNAISLPKDSSGEHYIPTDMMLRLMIRDQEERFITLIIGVRCSLVSSFLSFSYSVCWPPSPITPVRSDKYSNAFDKCVSVDLHPEDIHNHFLSRSHFIIL